MAIRDVDDRSRLDHATALVRDEILPALSADYDVELLSFGDAVDTADLGRLEADADHTDLGGALDDLSNRLGRDRVAGIVIVSDGGETGRSAAVAAASRSTAPVFATGVGRTGATRDREVIGVTAGEPTATGSTIDVSATIATHGFGTEPIDVRLLEDGRLLDVRRVEPASDGAPVLEVFRVSPDSHVGTVYTVEIPVDALELVDGNNRRSIVVRPPDRPRRVLMVEGAPGYEHSFLKRTWFADPGLALDAVVRKGQNDRGEHTFYVQGESNPGATLATGYPETRDALFQYDAVVLANIEAEFFTSEQLQLTAEFVGNRGGGVLVLGPDSLRRRGYLGSPFEPVLPATLVERLGLADGGDVGSAAHRINVTDEGAAHPMMQLGRTPAETRARWTDVPALAGTVRIGPVRPGASVLAVASTPSGDGGQRPLVVVQRFGAGRSMIFAGRASWRWQMLRPAADRVYETYWGQVGRWLAGGAADPVAVQVRGAAMPGRRVGIDVYARDREFRPIRGADVVITLTDAAGVRTDVVAVLDDAGRGRYAASLTPSRAGVYRVDAAVSDDGQTVGTAREWLLVGGSDPELTDPWLDVDLLGRVANAGGGAYVAPADVATLPRLVRAAAGDATHIVTRELWHSVWLYMLVVGFLSAEWMLRRMWGMR